jgi:Zn-finger nucleic acid-binding protein
MHNKPRSGYRPHGSGLPRCPSCGQQLDSDREQRENICGALKCRGPWLQRNAVAQRQKERDKQHALDESARSRLRDLFPEVLHGTQSGELLLIVVPGIEGESAEPTAERIAEFRAALEESFAEAERLAAAPERADELLSGYEPQQADSGALPIINACSTCRGWCCQMGRFDAFLKPEFLAWRLVHEQGVTAAELLDDYMARIPERSQTGSCVFHTASGCALPWQIRSSTCNCFLCPGLSQYRSIIEESPERATAAVSVDDKDYFAFGQGDVTIQPPCVRLGVMDSAGNRTEYTL